MKKWFYSVIAIGLLCATVHAQVPGQPYEIPAGYEGYSAGTLINYGGANYVIQDNGTMLLPAQAPVVNGQVANGGYTIVDKTQYQIPQFLFRTFEGQ